MSRTIESILVPTDGSDRAEIGARRGIDLAAKTNADLHVLSVVDVRQIKPFSNLDSNSRNERDQLLQQKARKAVDSVEQMAPKNITDQITTAIGRGVPFRRINEYADTHKIDHIVMGTQGRTGLDRVMLGSVAEKTLRTASIPVMTVPQTADVSEIGEDTYTTILLPTDGSERAELAISWGVTLAETYDATLHTIFSVDKDRFAGGEGKKLHESLEETGRNALKTVRESADTASVRVEDDITFGPPADQILSYCDDNNIDLIVMGTHGRSGINRQLIGSVTETVVRNAELPVCCVPME